MDYAPFKAVLEAELKQIESELASVGRLDADNKVDWVPRKEEADTDTADRDAVADSLESLEENTAILTDLEIRYNEIKTALTQIETKTYGKCLTCGGPIELDRLGANPAATTCKKDMN